MPIPLVELQYDRAAVLSGTPKEDTMATRTTWIVSSLMTLSVLIGSVVITTILLTS